MLMHALLLGFLWVGISWQNTTPVAIEAEIWSPQARLAAPPAPPEPAPVEPEPEPVKAVPPPPPPVAEPEPKAKTPDPDIALEKEKKRKEALEKKLAQEKARKEELEKKRLAEEEKRQQDIEKRRLAEEQEKKKLAELDKKKAEEQKRKQEADEKKRADEEKHKQEEQLLAEQRDKAQRERALKRLQALAGEGGQGDADKTSAPKTNANYLGKIAGKIKLNTRFPAPDSVPGDPAFEYDIELLPDGSVKEIKIVRPSGYPAFDEAVKRAIHQTAPFPADPDTGKVPSSIPFRSRLKDNIARP